MTSKERQRARFLQQAFSITPPEWELIYTHQHGVCFICGKPQKGKRLATDHCHQTGLLRGLLCNKCNAWLGKIENSFRRYGLHKTHLSVGRALLLIAAYLRETPSDPSPRACRLRVPRQDRYEEVQNMGEEKECYY